MAARWFGEDYREVEAECAECRLTFWSDGSTVCTSCLEKALGLRA